MRAASQFVFEILLLTNNIPDFIWFLVTKRIKTLQQRLRVSDKEGRIRGTVDSTFKEDLEVLGLLKSGAKGEKSHLIVNFNCKKLSL